MWKKLLFGIFICGALLTINTVGYATGDTTTKAEPKNSVNIDKKRSDLDKYQLISPEKTSYTSTKKIAFVNGKAPSGTIVNIKVYGTTDLTRKNFNLSKLPKADDYIEAFADEVKSGNMGFFNKQLDLVAGINKIILNFDVEGVPNIEIIVLVKTNTVKSTQTLKITDIIPLK